MATETKVESTLWERFTDKLGAITEGVCTVQGEIVSEAEVAFVLMDR